MFSSHEFNTDGDDSEVFDEIWETFLQVEPNFSNPQPASITYDASSFDYAGTILSPTNYEEPTSTQTTQPSIALSSTPNSHKRKQTSQPFTSISFQNNNVRANHGCPEDMPFIWDEYEKKYCLDIKSTTESNVGSLAQGLNKTYLTCNSAHKFHTKKKKGKIYISLEGYYMFSENLLKKCDINGYNTLMKNPSLFLPKLSSYQKIGGDYIIAFTSDKLLELRKIVIALAAFSNEHHLLNEVHFNEKKSEAKNGNETITTFSSTISFSENVFQLLRDPGITSAFESSTPHVDRELNDLNPNPGKKRARHNPYYLMPFLWLADDYRFKLNITTCTERLEATALIQSLRDYLEDNEHSQFIKDVKNIYLTLEGYFLFIKAVLKKHDHLFEHFEQNPDSYLPNTSHFNQIPNGDYMIDVLACYNPDVLNTFRKSTLALNLLIEKNNLPPGALIVSEDVLLVRENNAITNKLKFTIIISEALHHLLPNPQPVQQYPANAPQTMVTQSLRLLFFGNGTLQVPAMEKLASRIAPEMHG